jgi:hypothetical protein
LAVDQEIHAMKTDLDNLRERVKDTLDGSEIKSAFGEFHLEEDHDEFGSEYLRIIFDLKPGPKVPVRDLLSFARSIENNIGTVDERLASVRFTDPD